MLSSPAKRRKTSETTSVPVDNSSNDNGDHVSRPSTPRRASYLSPTKASLARSHPHLAQSNERRSRSQPRGGRSLIDDFLKAKNAADGGPAQTLNTNTSTNTNTNITTATANTTTTTITKSPPKKPADSLAPRTEPRAPLQSRQPSASDGIIAQNFIPPPVVPKLVPRFEGSTPSRARSPPLQRNQPNLPPTPVDLGWDDPPDRPRGLFSSSSPRGSSGRRRRRIRDNQTATSSPLKPKDPPPPVGERLGGQNDGADMAEEPEEEEQEAQVEHDDDEPIELRHKRDELQRLRERFRALKESTAKLGQAVNDNALLGDGGGALDNEAVSASVIARLKNNSAFRDSNFEELITTETEADKYLNLLAPGGLQLAVESSTEAKEDGHPRVIYHLTVSAPPPWPASLFSASLDVVTNAETAAVEQVLWTGSELSSPGKKSKTQTQAAVGITAELLDWADACLRSDLQGRNAAILLWGMGQYFDKAVRRARAFWRLTARYSHGDSNSGRNGEDGTDTATTPTPPPPPTTTTITPPPGAQLGKDHVLQLARYLNKTQLTIDLPQPQHQQQEEEDGGGGGSSSGEVPSKKKTVQPKLMVTWNIDLDWTGVAKNRCNIVPSGIPEGAVPAVKEVFARLVAVQGFQRAFDAVYRLVSSSSAADSNDKAGKSGGDAPAKASAERRNMKMRKKKKRKRFT